MRSVGAQGDGNYNVGRYSNPQMDALIERIKAEVDQKTRNQLIEQALVLSHQDVSHIPLHNQVIPWAMKKNIELYHRADNRVDMRGVIASGNCSGSSTIGEMHRRVPLAANGTAARNSSSAGGVSVRPSYLSHSAPSPIWCWRRNSAI